MTEGAPFSSAVRNCTVARIAAICDREFFHPFDQRVWKEALTLRDAGYTVEILTPHPQTETREVNGIRVYCISTAGPPGITALRLLRQAQRGDYDAFHCHELDPLLYALLLRPLTGKPVVWDCHEDYPSLVTTLLSPGGEIEVDPVRQSFVSALIRLALTQVSAVVTVTPPLVQRYQRIGPTLLVPNLPPRHLFNPERKSRQVASLYRGRRVVVYQGGIKAGRGLEVLLSAMQKVIQEQPEALLVVAGGEIDKSGWGAAAGEFLRSHGDHLHTTGWVEHAELAPYLVHADVGVVLTQPTHYNNIIGLPNKLFEYLACGLPVVASDLPQMARVVKRYDCGVLVNPAEPEEVADAILRVLEEPSATGGFRQTALRASGTLTWERCAPLLTNLYRRLVSGK